MLIVVAVLQEDIYDADGNVQAVERVSASITDAMPQGVTSQIWRQIGSLQPFSSSLHKPAFKAACEVAVEKLKQLALGKCCLLLVAFILVVHSIMPFLRRGGSAHAGQHAPAAC